MKTLIVRTSVLMLLSTVSIFTVKAQKLPVTQEKTVLLPQTAIADGKTTEWTDGFQAFNKSTSVYYTLATNRDNLYLALQITDPLIIKKVIAGGITLTLNTSGQKTAVNSVSITFPMIAVTSQSGIALSVDALAKSTNDVIADSITLALNKKIVTAEKEVMITGSKATTDSLISIYNNLGLKVATVVDKKGAFTYELIVPLKLIGLAETKESSIAYNIRLNGLPAPKQMPTEGRPVVTSMPRGLANSSSDAQILSFPTDFWADYMIKNQ